MINCIAIDDEPIALDVIKDHASKIPFLNLMETFRNAIEAIDYLQKNKVDLIFLDINMPKLSGLQFLDLLTERPLIIFTTAYSEYAIKGYEYDAIYYLLKPFNFQNFLKAVTKANNLLNKDSKEDFKETKVSNKKEERQEYVMVKSGTKIHKININDILYLKKDGSYVFFHFKDNKLISRLNINEILELLPQDKFTRVHKSYIIAINKIEIIETHQIIINKTSIPIGNIYREEFLKKIK